MHQQKSQENTHVRLEYVNGVSFVLCLTWKGTFIFTLISLLVEACAGDIPSIPDHFRVPDSFVIAFCNCWCHASRTKGGAKKNKNPTTTATTPFNLLRLLLVISPFGTVPAAVFFSHSQLFPFACMLLLFAFLHGVMC